MDHGQTTGAELETELVLRTVRRLGDDGAEELLDGGKEPPLLEIRERRLELDGLISSHGAGLARTRHHRLDLVQAEANTIPRTRGRGEQADSELGARGLSHRAPNAIHGNQEEGGALENAQHGILHQCPRPL